MIGLINFYEKKKFSLKSLSVNCNIRNLLISCTSEFIYKNEENEDIEALFSFPMDSNCVVYHLEAVIGNKTILGVCKEIDEAKNLYKAATEMGHKAAMIERNTSMMDVFKCRIGNFPKNSEAKIILKFSMELRLSLARSEEEGVDRFNLALPLILNPRYTPTEYQGDREIYQVTNKFEHYFKACLIGTKVIHNITSVNHQLNINYTNENHTSAEVSLKCEHDGTVDLEVNVDYVSMREPSVILEPGTGSERYTGKVKDGAFYKSDVAMINFLPKFDVRDENKSKLEVVFIVDRSGSMAGSNIKNAKTCLVFFIKSLPVNCKFQIYGFGDTFDKAFSDSQFYTDESIKVALFYEENIQADFGGTELMRPLTDMYNSQLSTDYTRVAFVLTDGDVGNQDEVIGLVRSNNKTTKLFTIGIGDGVSTSLVSKVAEAGYGKAAFVRNSRDLSSTVMELLDVALNCDQFSQTKLDWECPEHVTIVTVPKVIPPIFSNYFLTVFCMINGMKPTDVIRSTLSGNVNNKNVSFTVEITDANVFVDEEFRVHRLLAKYKIDEMTLQIDEGDNEIKKPLIELSTDVNIMTNWTTFVAIDPTAPEKVIVCANENIQDIEESFYAADELTFMRLSGNPEPEAQMGCVIQTMNHLSRLASMQACNVSAFSTTKPEPKSKKSVRRLSMPKIGLFKTKEKPEVKEEKSSAKALRKISHEQKAKRGSKSVSSNPMSFEEKELSQNDDIILYIVRQQNIFGFWNFCEDLFIRMGLNVPLLHEKKPGNVTEDVWATVIVYQYLTTKEQAREKEWRLVAKKARSWIEKNVNDSKLTKDLFQATLECF